MVKRWNQAGLKFKHQGSFSFIHSFIQKTLIGDHYVPDIALDAEVIQAAQVALVDSTSREWARPRCPPPHQKRGIPAFLGLSVEKADYKLN